MIIQRFSPQKIKFCYRLWRLDLELTDYVQYYNLVEMAHNIVLFRQNNIKRMDVLSKLRPSDICSTWLLLTTNFTNAPIIDTYYRRNTRLVV